MATYHSRYLGHSSRNEAYLHKMIMKAKACRKAGVRQRQTMMGQLPNRNDYGYTQYIRLELIRW